jgi:hypothetical protein
VRTPSRRPGRPPGRSTEGTYGAGLPGRELHELRSNQLPLDVTARTQGSDVQRSALRRLVLPIAALAVVMVGCADDQEPVSSDPDGLEEPADAPEGAPEDDLGDGSAEEGTGEPAVEGDSEGQFDPDDDEDE